MLQKNRWRIATLISTIMTTDTMETKDVAVFCWHLILFEEVTVFLSNLANILIPVIWSRWR